MSQSYKVFHQLCLILRNDHQLQDMVLSSETTLEELVLDWMDLMELAMHLEEELDITPISEAALDAVCCLGDLVELACDGLAV